MPCRKLLQFAFEMKSGLSRRFQEGRPADFLEHRQTRRIFQTSDPIRYNFMPPIDQALLGRTTGLYLALAASDDIVRLQPHFDSVELIATIWRTWNGDPIEPYRVYELRGYRGGVPY